MATIRELPNELLLEIALAVDVTGLQSLSLACHQLQSIGQEALLRTVVLAPANIWKLASTLHARPDLAKAFTHLHLGSFTKAVYDDLRTIARDQWLKAGREGSTWGAWCEMLAQAYPAMRRRSLDQLGDPFDGIFDALALITALSPSAKRLTLTTTALDNIDFMRILLGEGDGTPDPGRHEQLVRSLVQSRLQNLEIEEEKDIMHPIPLFQPRLWGATPKHKSLLNIQLVRFTQLKRLVVPLYRISRRYEGLAYLHDPSVWGHSNPTEVLPKTLETIILQMDRRVVAGDFLWVADTPNAVPTLQNLELRFPLNRLSTAWGIASVPHIAQQILGALRPLESNLVFFTSFGNEKFAGLRRLRSDEIPGPSPGDLVVAIERCLATSMEQLERDAELMNALGYCKRPL